MPSVTGTTNLEGGVTLIEVPADLTLQVWSIALYAVANAPFSLLTGSTVRFTSDHSVGNPAVEAAARGPEPLIQGSKGEDLILEQPGNEFYYNIVYTLI